MKNYKKKTIEPKKTKVKELGKREWENKKFDFNKSFFTIIEV